MALFLKPDFSPPILSRKWLAMKFRPNMMIHCHYHVVAILESGLLFREDSAEVEQEAPAGGGGGGPWLTRGERALAAAAAAALLLALPPKNLSRATVLRLAALPALPVAARCALRRRPAALPALLAVMRRYLALARRAAACVRECAVFHRNLESLSATVSAARALLTRQQRVLASLMARASAALLAAAPWLRADLAWDALQPSESLKQTHHAFLVVQSTLLKHIALSHFTPSVQAQRLYANHNERLHWLHTVVIEHLLEEFKLNYDTLDRMYRLLKNYGNTEAVKTPGAALSNSWLYSDVHAGVARSAMELKMAAEKCTSLDIFLDNCAREEQDLSPVVLNKDIDDLIELITTALKTTQHAQLRLRKLKTKFGGKGGKVDETAEDESVVIVEMAPTVALDREPESKDEVFYCVKTEADDVVVEQPSDSGAAPGKREKENSRVMFDELKRKLVKREDLMRERERQALVNTMPELKGNVPEFPRQIAPDQYTEKRGYIKKVLLKSRKRSALHRTSRDAKFKNPLAKNNISVRHRKYHTEPSEISQALNAKVNVKNDATALIDLSSELRSLVLTVWHRQTHAAENHHHNRNHRQCDELSTNEREKSDELSHELSKKERETSQQRAPSPLSPLSSDDEVYLLRDVRRQRPARRKNHPSRAHRPDADKTEDEPAGYSLKQLMDMAATLQANRHHVAHKMADEEVFVGYGELSGDSGNEEDA